MTPLRHRFYRFPYSKRPDSTLLYRPIYTCIHTPVHTPWVHLTSILGATVRAAAVSQKGAPAIVFTVILISHETLGVLTVKHTVIYDAVVRFESYPSTLTNKEETFLTLRYSASATASVGRCYMAFYHAFGTVTHRLLFYAPLPHVSFTATKGLNVDSGRLSMVKRCQKVYNGVNGVIYVLCVSVRCPRIAGTLRII